MAYNFSKGKRTLGDITFEDDHDTGIDFENDMIKLETAGNEVLVVSGSKVGINVGSPNEMLSVGFDGDNSAEIGKVHIGYAGHANLATFCHVDQNSTTGYAMGQNSAGSVIFNVPTGQTYRWRVNNSDTGAIGIDTNLNMGIGTLSPRVPLHVNKGTDVTLASKTSGYLLIGDEDSVNIAIDNNEIMARDNATASPLHLNINGGAVKIGNVTSGQGIQVNTDGTTEILGGVIKSPGVKVNSALDNNDNRWIKIATMGQSGNDYDIAMSTFLVTFVGVYYADSQPQRQRYMVQARVLSDDDSDPYWDDKGTDLIVTPLDSEHLDGFNPETDILLAIERDSTPVTDIWIKATQKSVDVYVSHLNGSKQNTSSTDIGWTINTGQSWATAVPDTAAYSLVYGFWASQKMKNFETVGAEIRQYTTVSFSGFSVYGVAQLPGPTGTPDNSPDRFLLCNDGGTHDGNGHRVVGLPAVATSDKRVITIKDSDGSAASSNIRVTGNSSETIDGSAHVYITTNYGAITVLCNGSEWKIIGKV